MTHYWFISTRYRHNSRLALIAFIFAFFVIMLGAYTRLTDAGLSCPDWPHCYGFITAPHTASQLQDAARAYPAAPVEVKKAWTEMIHRYCAGIEAILIVTLAGSIFFYGKMRDRKSTIIGAALIGLLGVQILLGALTVTKKLTPEIVLSHLLTGISILGVLWWAYLDVFLADNSFISKARTRTNVIPWLWLGLFVVAGQITLGGWVSTHYAGLACVDFPYCNGRIIPNMQWDNLSGDLITIHMLHRIGAMITAAYTGALALYLVTSKSFRSLGILLFALLALQLTLGILNIVWLRPVWLAMMHQAVAIFLLLTVIMALVKATIMRGNRHGSWIA